nr:probable cinnamyl alcohol dehydrogenase 6 [Ipomoea batatas]
MAQKVLGWAAHDDSGKLRPFIFTRRYEIVGIITKVGSNVGDFKIGDRVGVGYVSHTCLKCELCNNSKENYCDQMRPVYNAIASDGSVTYGVYCAMKNSNIFESPGKQIGVIGLGGLGHMAIKFAKAFGHHVTVISTSPSKEKLAKDKLGSDHFILSTNPTQMQWSRRSLDFILDTVSANHSLGPYIELLKVDGTLAIVGEPPNPIDFPSTPLIYGKRTIKGSIIGSVEEIEEMMDLCGKYEILPDIELVSPKRINEAFDRLLKNDVKFRFVLDIAGDQASRL